MASLEDKAFQERVGRVETLIAQIESSPDSALRSSAVELLQAVMELHGMGLERMLDITWETGEPGEQIIGLIAQDDLLRSLLLLHGLHPLDLETRVTQALDKVRPYLGSHGGNVELLGVEDGVVKLRLQGSCHGCASSAMTLKLAIEEAIQEFAPDIAGLDVEGVVEPPPMPASSFIPLTQVGSLNSSRRHAPTIAQPGWQTLLDTASLFEDTTRLQEVAGTRVLLCRLNSTLYAYSAECPGCGQSLEQSAIRAGSLHCAECGNDYDLLRAGRCLSKPSIHLEPFPLLEREGKVSIAVPTAVAP